MLSITFILKFQKSNTLFYNIELHHDQYYYYCIENNNNHMNIFQKQKNNDNYDNKNVNV